MPIDTRNSKILAAAKAAIKAGDLPKAQNYLLMAEGEEAEKLLDRVNKAIAARGSATVAQEKAKHESVAQVTSKAVAEGIKQAEKEKLQLTNKRMGYGCLVILVMCGACWLFSLYVTQPKPAENLARMCELVRSVNFQCDPQAIMRDYPNEVEYCQTTYGNFVDVDELKYTWQNCLRSRGVEFVPES